MNIDGQIALITGGASGLGAATARYLAGKGAHIMVLDYDLQGAKAMADELGGHAVGCDVSDEDAVARAIDETVSICGVPRIVVNCAGIATGARIVGREGKLSTGQFRKTIEVNLIGSYHVMSYAARAMMQTDPLEGSERGVIINTSSAAFEDGQLGQAAYSASKGGIASLSLPAARELARYGIRVNAIAPAGMATPMVAGLRGDPNDLETTKAQLAMSSPLKGRPGLPEDVVNAALWLASDEAGYTSGHTLTTDAGLTIGTGQVSDIFGQYMPLVREAGKRGIEGE